MNRLPVREVLITIMVLVSVAISVVKKNWISMQDWRSAIQTAQSYRGNDSTNIPVIISSGLIESKQIEWLSDPIKTSYILAPLAIYPLDKKVFPLPPSMDENLSRQYSINLFNHTSCSQCLFIGMRDNDEFGVEKSFGALAEKLGYRKRYLINHPKEGRPFVMLFER